MIYFLLALSLITFWHFVVEAIILPAARQEKRNELFVLRDRLRNLIISRKGSDEEQLIRNLHESVKFLINRLHRVTLANQYLINKKIDHDATLRREIEEDHNYLCSRSTPEVQEVYREASRIVRNLLFVNSSGWLVYIVPVLVIILFFKQVKRLTIQFLLIPTNEIIKLIPRETPHAAERG